MSHGLIHDSEHTRFKWMMLISLHINDFIDSQVMVIRTDCRNSEVFRFAPHEGKARTLLLNNGNFTIRKKTSFVMIHMIVQLYVIQEITPIRIKMMKLT
jgi:hypothetical protein